MSHYADVILPLNIKNLLTYSLSEEMHQHCQIGSRVAVPLGEKRLLTAVVVNIHKNKPLHYEVKPIKEILDAFPIVTLAQLKLFKWVKNYYLSSYGLILKACLPGALLIQSETLLQRHEEFDFLDKDLSDDEFLIMEAISKQAQIKMSDAQKILGKTSGLKVVNDLLKQNLICIDRQVKQKYRPKLTTYIRIAKIYDSSNELKNLLEELSRAEKQKEAILYYFKIKANFKKPLSKKVLKDQGGISYSTLKTLVDKGIFEQYSIQEDRIKRNKTSDTRNFSLSNQQSQAFNRIQNHFKTDDVVLFKGVTSSGKTEIYLKLIEQYLVEQKQVLYLLPEIALTTQLIKRIEEHFGDKVLVYHSKYTANERVEIYKHVLGAGDGQVIIGTRSAIFLPFQYLKFIIVDESHENSYKQHDPSPRYHARDTAVVLGKIHKAKVLMGSATPSLESFYNVKLGKFKYVELNKRFGDVKPPKIKAIDLKEKYKRKKMKGHFSDELCTRIKETLDHGKQVIIFQNRRGYSPVIECLTCGHSPQCPHCDVSLTLHKSNNTMRCHYCGYKMAVQKRCLSCGSAELSSSGFGTEQIEIEAKAEFPKANIKRMDLDTTRGKYDFEKIIAGFENLEIDILIGTQMLTKGLDFRHVDLVAVMHADSLFHFPNFRAFEKSYQLLVQVAGRAGRTDKQGEVLIQTFQPTHSVIEQVISENYIDLYKTEIQQRQEFNYPPFYRMIKLIFKSKDYNRLNEAADWLAIYLKQIFSKQVLGPEFPGIARIRNQYIKQIILKIPPQQSLSKTKSYLMKGIDRYESVARFKGVRLNIDVDPYS